MKYLTTIHNIDNLPILNKYDGFIIGSDDFAARLTRSFSTDEINEVINYSTNNNKEIFLLINKMFTDEEFLLLNQFIRKINVKDLTGIIVSDFGVVQYLIELNQSNKIVWQGETLSTNTHDFNFLSEFNLMGSFTAKEITLDDVLQISRSKSYKHFITGHGHLNMFYSKRHLLENFMKKYDLEFNSNKYSFKIVENQRDKSYFPILEDKAGTHVFRSNVLNSFKYLKDLSKTIDYFVVDSIFKDDEYSKEILELYQNGYKEDLVEEIKTKYQENWDEGFYETKTVYIKV